AVEAFAATFAGAGVHLDRLGRAAMARRVPGLRPDWTLALFEPTCADIDVAGLHQHYLAGARSGGANLRVSARLAHAEREGDGWRLGFGEAGEARAAVLVDAAGAWADEVAALAGVGPLGIAPLRRTMAQVRTDPRPAADLPLVLDI